MERLIGMFLVEAFDRLFQLCQRAEIRGSLQLLLAFAAGKEELPFPRRRKGFELNCHHAGLDAVGLNAAGLNATGLDATDLNAAGLNATRAFRERNALFYWCAQHGRTLTGASPVTSWSRRVK
jgi:hypothetical protein